jgi:hypothetical protein
LLIDFHKADEFHVCSRYAPVGATLERLHDDFAPPARIFVDDQVELTPLNFDD